MESVVKKQLTFQKLSITHCQPFPALLWVTSPVSVWQEFIGIWSELVFELKSLKHFLFWNVASQWILRQIISLMITFPVERLFIFLYECTNTATTHSATASTSSGKALIVPWIERGLREMCHWLKSWVRSLHHQHSWAVLIWGLDLFYKVDGNIYNNLPKTYHHSDHVNSHLHLPPAAPQ